MKAKYSFDFKRAAKNFVQIFVFGYVTLLVLGISYCWLNDSSFAFKDLTLHDLLNPIFWLLPFVIAGQLAPCRGFAVDYVGSFTDSREM